MERRLRDKIDPNVLPCDIKKKNPLEPSTPESFDIVTTQFCVEAACLSEDVYEEAVSNITSLLKPGGVIYQLGVIEETFYFLGDKKFKALYLPLDLAERALKTSGCRDIHFETHMYPEVDESSKNSAFGTGVTDCKGLFLARAVKA